MAVTGRRPVLARSEVDVGAEGERRGLDLRRDGAVRGGRARRRGRRRWPTPSSPASTGQAARRCCPPDAPGDIVGHVAAVQARRTVGTTARARRKMRVVSASERRRRRVGGLVAPEHIHDLVGEAVGGTLGGVVRPPRRVSFAWRTGRAGRRRVRHERARHSRCSAICARSNIASLRHAPRRSRSTVLARRAGGQAGSGAEDAAGGLRPLAADAAALTLGEPAPDAELLAVLEGELEALLAHDAPAADLLGLARRGAPLGEEEVGIDAEAVGVVLPAVIARDRTSDSNESYMRGGPPAVWSRAALADDRDGDIAVITSM